jgi:hypothetical protein
MSIHSHPRLSLSTACACGAVKVSLNGPAYVMLLCSCVDCQKATGTGHSAVTFVNAEDFLVEGETTQFSRPADSGAVFTRHFCPRCGTPIYGRSSRAPRFAMVPVGLFGGESSWFQPNQLIFARTHQDWDVIASDLPQHLAYRERGEVRR